MSIRPYIPAFFSLCLSALGAPESPPAKSDHAAPSETPIEWAVRFTGYLQSERDQQAEHGVMIASAFADTGQIGEAHRIVQMLTGFRQNAALYRLAGTAARLGDAKASAKLFAEAEAAPAGTRDFEVQEIKAARVESLAVMGRAQEAREALGTIPSDAVRIETEALIFEHDALAVVEERAREFADRKVTSQRLKGHALLAAAGAHAKAGHREKALVLTHDAIEAMCKGADGATIPLLRRAVGLLVQFGEKKEAARWAEVCAGFAQRVDPRAYWKARDVRLAAECLRDSGEEEKAVALLKELPELTTSLTAMDYARGGMDAAQSFLLEGKVGKFHEAAAHVLKHLRTHPHFRARAMAGLDVLAAYVRARQDIPQGVRDEFAATAASIEKDPHYLNPI